jgi:hypothetical protein
MTTASIEQRIRALESEVAELKRRLQGSPSPTEPWWEKISGIFAGDPAFQEAQRLGRAWRDRENARSLPKKKRTGRKKSKNVRS